MYICRHLLWQSPVFAVSIARRGAARAPSVPARPLPAGRRIQGSGRPPAPGAATPADEPRMHACAPATPSTRPWQVQEANGL
jgi:hypothetical protein